MPESAHKRRLVAKLNDANGRGTPEVATSGSVRTIGRMAARQRRRSGEGFMNLLTPRRKRPAVTGSYSVKGARTGKLEPSHSFRRQNSSAVHSSTVSSTASSTVANRPMSPHTVSSPAVLSPCRDRLPSPPPTGETPVSQASEVCAVEEIDTPGKDSDDSEDDIELDSEPDHDGSYSAPAPPLPPRTPNPATTTADTMSPMSLAITTPRNRGGLMLCSNTQLDRWKMLLDSQQSPCHPPQYNEDEPEEPEELGRERQRSRSEASGNSRNSRSLSSEFKDFLASQGMEAADESEVSDGSLLETSGSYSEEVRKLLGKNATLSTSLQAALDGDDPNSGVLTEKVASAVNIAPEGGVTSGKLVPENTENTENSENTENTENVSPGGGQPRRGIKRRSITEAGPQTVTNVASTVQNSNAIIFETDL